MNFADTLAVSENCLLSKTSPITGRTTSRRHHIIVIVAWKSLNRSRVLLLLFLNNAYLASCV